MGSPLRRRNAVLVGVLALLGACTGRVGEQVGRAAPSSTGPAASAPASPSGGTAAAGPTSEVRIAEGEAGLVQLPDGATLTVPDTAVVRDKIVARLTRTADGVYEPRIDGAWTGRIELRVPGGTPQQPFQQFLLGQAAKGWSVLDAERRTDNNLYVELGPPLTPVRLLTCNVAATDAAGLVTCLNAAGVTPPLPADLVARLVSGLGCAQPWPATDLLGPREQQCPTAQPSAPPSSSAVTQPPTTVAAPAPAPATPPATVAPPPPASSSPVKSLVVRLTEEPVHCDGTRRAFGVISGAYPGETITFSSPGITSLRDGHADDNGSVTIHWLCQAMHVGWSWTMTATGASSHRSVTFEFHGGSPA